MIKKQGKIMNGNLACLLGLDDLSESNEEFFLVNENKGYDPYDNPGTNEENLDEAD